MNKFLNRIFRWDHLTVNETLLYKGVGILLILAHNFLHLIKPLPSENEFTYERYKFDAFINQLISTPEDTVRILLTYLGHYGVQIFIFLSAYGLTKKYINLDISYKAFIKRRLFRIYPAFTLAIIFYLLSGFIHYGYLGPLKIFYWKWESIVLKLLMISNFVPNESLQPVGPWWFLPFIVGFYFAFPFLLKLLRKFGTSSLILLSIISYLPVITLYYLFKDNGLNVYYMFIGHLPEFCIGMVLAVLGKKSINLLPYAIVSLLVFILGNLYESFWFFTHLAMMIIGLSTFGLVIRLIKRSKIAHKVVLFIGNISFHLFLVNGFLREPMSQWATKTDHWLFSIIMCLVSISCSVLIAYLLMKTEKYVFSIRPPNTKLFTTLRVKSLIALIKKI